MFKISGKGTLLLGSLLVALALTGGMFAYGYLTSTTTLSNVTSAGGDFAKITTAGTGLPTWKVFGSLKGTIGSGNLFVINTSSVNYTGDLVSSVSLANGDQLVKVYRVLNLFLKASSSNGSQIDINSDNIVDSQDFALLTLSNGSVDFFISQPSGSDNYTIQLDRGFYVSHVFGLGWPAGAHQPVLYADVGQR